MFSPALWDRASASHAVPDITPVGAVAFEVGLDALPQGMPRCVRPPQLACQADRGFALGHAAQEPHQGGWSLGVVATTVPVNRV